MVFTFNRHTTEEVTIFFFFNLYLCSLSSEIPKQMQNMQCQVLQGLIGPSIAGVVRDLDPTLDIYEEHLCCFSFFSQKLSTGVSCSRSFHLLPTKCNQISINFKVLFFLWRLNKYTQSLLDLL